MVNSNSATEISRLRICLRVVLFLVFGISSIYAQVIYQGPAFGSITGGATVTTGSFDGKGISGLPQRILNEDWEENEPPLVDDKYNNTPPLAPLGSNEFIDPAVLLNPSALQPPAVVNDFRGNLQTSSIPPDPIMAVGPNHIISMVNTSFVIWDKAGNILFQSTADAWLSNVLPYSGAFDPVIIYDHFAERWVQLWDLQNDNNQTGYWLVSVSDDSDPMGTWCNYSFPAHFNGMSNVLNWGDYPKMGYDDQAIYISGRQFGFGTGFQYCKIRIIPKSELYDPGCGPVNYTDFWNFRDPANAGVRVDGPPIAATHLDSTNNIAYFVVDAPYNVSTFITLWTIEDPLSTNPTVSATNIPTTAALEPPDANQLGGGSPLIDSGRRTYRNAVYKDGNIWTATAVAGGTANQYAFTRYLRIDVNSHSVLEDVSFGANGFYYLYPAVMVTENNDLVMVFTRTATNEYAGAAYAGRLSSDPPGLSPSVLLKEGEANYVKTFGSARNRWGDYMGIALDPFYNNQIWGLIEYAASPANTWGTWIGAFTHQYKVAGVARDAVTLNPIEFDTLKILETGRTIITDATGEFSTGSPTPNVTIGAGAFGYQDTIAVLSLTLYGSDSLDILMQPEIESTISGQVTDSITGQGINAELKFFAHGNPYPGAYDSTTTDANGFYNITTVVGDYDIVVYPEIPYPVTNLENVMLDANPSTIDIKINRAAVLLVNDDTNKAIEEYYQDALDNNRVSYYTWRINESGAPDNTTFNLFPDPKTVIWYTGNADTAVLSDMEQQNLALLLDNGGRLYLTGQNIAETSSNGMLLSNYFGVTFNTNITPPIIRGIAGDPIGDGLLLSSVGGAGNQISKDAILITGNADSVLYYGTSTPLGLAALRVEDVSAGWKAVFSGFGLEGLNNNDGKRDELMKRILDWFGVITKIEDEPGTIAAIPETFELRQNYPNPFNPETTIEFAVPQNAKVQIKIFNLLGQQVRELVNGNHTAGIHRVIWDGRNESGKMAPSGVYFYRMSTETGFHAVKKLLLMK